MILFDSDNYGGTQVQVKFKAQRAWKDEAEHFKEPMASEFLTKISI